MSGRSSCYPPIANYAVIGDCHTAALISRAGSIDWYCPGRFDGPAVFCRVLDAERGGFFRIAPRGQFAAERQYLNATNVLQTVFTTGDGRVRLTDFMPIFERLPHHAGHDVGSSHRVIRLVEGLSGEVELEARLKPTFNYARVQTELWLTADGAIAHGDGQYLALASPGVDWAPDGQGGLRGQLRLRAGEQCWLVLADVDDADQARRTLTWRNPRGELDATVDYWTKWADSCTYRGPYRDEVVRSALALKLLTYEPTGAIVAAPTTSLPEEIGGVRNWDYRYTWLRDSSLILYALITVGYQNEADDYLHWLARAVGPDPHASPSILYTIDGTTDLSEQALDNLSGYRDSRPVRIGNAAVSQRQLDIFGEVLRAAYLHYRGQRKIEGKGPGQVRPSAATWRLLRGLVDQAAERWQEPDRGIWEVRTGPRQFVYSKLMCWAALDRGLRLAHEHGLRAPVDRWRRTRDAIRQVILERGYNAKLGAFTQTLDGSALDASALIMSWVGFLPATDPRIRSTVDRIQSELTRNGLVYRYCTDDGLPGGENTFALCTFWLVDALALGGQLDEAHDSFERAVGYANDVGLLSEEIDAENGALLGNFPQGFSHLALVGAAVNLAKAARHGAEEQPENEAERAGRASQAASEGQAAGQRAESGQ